MFTKNGVRFHFKSLGAAALAVLFCSLEAAAPKVETFISPEPVRVGETAYLIIRSNDGTRNAPLTSRRPPVQNLEWGRGIRQSQSIQIINDRQSVIHEVQIPFTVTRPGTYTIPPFDLTHSREKTKPVEFTAVEARYSVPAAPAAPAPSAPPAVPAAPVPPPMPAPSYRSPGASARPAPAPRQTAPAPRPPQTVPEENRPPQPASGERSTAPPNRKETELTLDQILFAEAEIPGMRPRYYVGEEIPLEINVYLLAGARAQLTWPKISFGEKDAAVFHDYKNVNPENPNFSGAAQSSVEKNGRQYTLYSFKTAFRPISAGKMTITARIESALIVPDNRRASRSNDMFEDFFGDSFFSRDRRIARNMNTLPLTIEAFKVPPPENGEFYTGLVGLWKTDVTLSPPPYRVGEPITMKITFQGNGSLDTLRIRNLELKGFRVYPPEIDKSRSCAEIRYILIPTETSSGDTENIVLPPVSTFDPVSGKHVVTGFRRKIVVEKGFSVLPQNAAYVVESAAPSGTEQEPAKRRPEEVLYLKKLNGGEVFMPLWRNMLFSGGTVVFLGLLFWLAAEWVRFRRSVRENDPMFQRRAGAKKVRKELFARIAVMEPEEIPGKCSGEIASYISDTLGLPPGADLNECAKALEPKSPELAKMLDELSQAAWVPSMKSRFTKEFRASLLKALGKVGLFLLLTGALTLPGVEIALQKEIPIRNDAEAMNAYDAGQFDAAGKYYAAQLKKSRPSAKILYNMGNCLYRMGELPKALICYERALRLNPRDSDILENLNLVRRKLALPEKYKIDSPSDLPPYLRDSMRPDEWMFLFCCGWMLLFVALGCRALKFNRILVRSAAAAGLALLVFPGTAYLSQKKTSYSPDFAIVTVRNLPVYSLPSAQSGRIEMKLKAGEELSIVERRLDWVRIRSGDAEGWVRAKDITSLWMPDSISTN
ncbi:MAG: Tetratricopeptide repeat protein [Lentisphaerae bacterium ADurb.Bin242]|nr:MAG: Tetratricopeptide repeat protein [Lentisphaerae bacterium ADurb.Bin242]